MMNNNTINLLDSSSSEEDNNEVDNNNEREERSEIVQNQQEQETLEESLRNEIIEHHRAFMAQAPTARRQHNVPRSAPSSSGAGDGDVIELLGSSDEEDVLGRTKNDNSAINFSDSTINATKVPRRLPSTSSLLVATASIAGLHQQQPPDRILSIEETTAAFTTSPNTATATTVGSTIANSDNTDNIDNENNAHPRSLNFLKDHCWGCHNWIHHPGSTDRGTDTSANNEICCYALHLHPIIEVPVCVVCAENIEAVERQRQVSTSLSRNIENNNKNDENEQQCHQNILACSACGKSEDDIEEENERRAATLKLFFCDECPRIVCQKCLEQAHGRSEQSKLIVSQFEGEDENWMCFCCYDKNNNDTNCKYVPRLLQKLRTATKKLFSTANDDNDNDNNAHQRHQKQTLEELLHQLDIVETKKQQCDEKLDNETDIFEDRQDWMKHQTRLFDRISIIEDIIKSEYGLEAINAYRYIDDRNKIDNNDCCHNHNCVDKEENEEEKEPHWKISADRAISKKKEEERLEMRRKGEEQSSKDHPQYRLELTEDVEDLGSSSSSDDSESDNDDEKELFREGWRSAFCRARQEDIDIALEAEDQRRVEEKKARLIVRNRADDKKDIQEWSAGLKEMAIKNMRTSSSSFLKPPPSQVRTISISTASSSTSTSIEVPIVASNLPSRAFQKRDRGNKEGVEHVTTKASPAVASSDLQLTDAKSSEFQGSPIVLSENPSITVACQFAKHLKEHQKEGIKFMYNNSFADLGGNTNTPIGGCILAHSMGLGKSLACLSLLHAIMLQPSLVDPKTNRGRIHKVLFVVPVNTLSNWENEFEKWTKGMNKKLNITNISSGDKYSRKRQVKSWTNMGGVLLSSGALFRNMVKHDEMEKHLSSADAIVLDESHTLLKNKDNQVFKALMKIKTKRRICLSGTPFVNNLLEYYRMVSYIRPSLLGDSEKNFQKVFIEPIEAAMGSDTEHSVQMIADERLTELFQSLQPYVQRRDASILLADLPSLQQVVLHLRPTKLQRLLYAEYRKYQKATNQNNFLLQFASLRNVHNHPGALYFRTDEFKASKAKEDEAQKPSIIDKKRRSSVDTSSNRNKLHVLKPTSNDDETITGNNQLKKDGRESPDVDSIIEIMSSSDDDEGVESETDLPTTWWIKVGKKFGVDAMKSVESGNKCLVLFHILVHASMLEEKTVVFSQSLKTLDFLSEILASKDWQLLCPSIAESFPGIPFGGWTQNIDFLRIDGQTSASERGERIKDFSDNKKLKLFLISSVAGGIGTNLVSANRVVLMDSHFNPTIDLQAIYRCYRYGQTKNVFAYRLLTQGSMEEKVYSRAVNKTGLGNRVIDGKELRRCFKQDEINSLATVDDWVECVRCLKWRMLPPKHTCDMANIPDDWHCEMVNEHDQRMDLTCNFPEKEAMWYSQHFKKPNEKSKSSTSPSLLVETASTTISKAETEMLVERDELLKNILTISSRTKNPALIVSKHYFHDALLSEKDSVRELEKPKAAVETKPSDFVEMAENQEAKRKLNFQEKGSLKKQKKKKKKAKFLNRDFDDVNGKKKGKTVARDAPSTQGIKRERTVKNFPGYSDESSDDCLVF